MALNVAQLNIQVNADTSAAKAAIIDFSNTVTNQTQTVAAMAQQIVAGENAVVNVIQQFNGAMNASATAAVQDMGNVAASIDQVQGRVGGLGGGFGTMGSQAGMALSGIAMAAGAAGMGLGPLNSAIMLTVTTLMRIPAAASAAQVAIMGVAAVLTGLGAASAALGASSQQGFQQLQNAVNNTGESINNYKGRLDSAIESGAKMNRGQADVQNALAVLVQGAGDTTKGFDMMNGVMDVAARRHSTLEQAAKDVIRVLDGQGRGLKDQGLDLTFTHNATQKLTEAQNGLASSTQSVADHQTALEQATQRYNDRLAEQALAVDKIQKSEEALASAKANLIYVEQQQAAQDAIPRISGEETATRHLEDSQRSLMDLQARMAAQAQGTVAQNAAIEHSQDAVAAAQLRMARATGGQILPAQEALRNAISQQRDELDKLKAAQGGTLSEQQQLAKGQVDVARAQEDLIRAKAADAGSEALKAMQNQHAIEAATGAVEKAQDGVNQAVRDQQALVLKNADAYTSVINAQDSLNDAIAKQGLAQQKVLDATAAKVKEDNQGPDAVAQWFAKVQGAGDAAEKGWSGTLGRIKQDFFNWLADFGNAGGRFLTFLGPALLALNLLKVGLVADVAGTLLSAVVGALGTALAIITSPITLTIAAIALLTVGFYELYQHVGWFHDAVDAVANFVKDVVVGYFHLLWWELTHIGEAFLIVINFFKDLPGHVVNAIGDAKNWLANIGSDMWNGMVGGLNAAWHFVTDWLESVPKAVLSFFKDAGSWLLDAGKWVIEGLSRGILDWADKTVGHLWFVGGKIMDELHAALGINSPSTKTQETGRYLMEGLAKGIDDHAHLASDAMNAVAGKISGVNFTSGTNSTGISDYAGIGAVASMAGGGSTYVDNHISVTAAGSIIHERDLAYAIKDAVVTAGRKTGGDFFEGQA